MSKTNNDNNRGDSNWICTIRQFDIYCSIDIFFLRSHSQWQTELEHRQMLECCEYVYDYACHAIKNEWNALFIICINFYLKKAGNQNRWRKHTASWTQMDFYHVQEINYFMVFFNQYFWRIYFLCKRSTEVIEYFIK